MSYQQALQDIQSGHFESAIEHLTRLLQVDPDQPKLWQAKALAWLSLERPEAAITDAEQAIRLNPQLAPAHRLVGNAYSKLGNTEKAIAAYKQAARCYLNRQDKINAQACLTQIEQLRPSSSPLLSSQSFLAATATQIQQGQYRDALEHLNWLLQFEPNNAEALAQRSLLQFQCHNHPAAVKDLSQAMQLSPDNPALRLQRGEMRLKLGDGHGAIADFSALLHLRSDNLSQLYNLRGQAYQQINDPENAFKDFSNALGIDPTNADCYKSRGGVYETMGDLVEALANYRQASTLHLDQGNWAAHQELRQQIQALETKLQTQKDEAARIVRVPIKHLSGGTPVIEVMFNGCCPFDMVLDTGAGITCLTEQMARLLNIIPTGTKQFRLADGRIVEAPVSYVRSAAIDRLQVNDLEVAICPGTEGLLGQNYLWRYNIRILRTEVEFVLLNP